MLNRCRLEDGGQIEAEGVARIAGKQKPNSILKVRFAPAFLSFIPQVWGDYQIIELAPDYTHALVGDPGRKYLWVLSRSARMDDAIYNDSSIKPEPRDSMSAKLQKTRQSGG